MSIFSIIIPLIIIFAAIAKRVNQTRDTNGKPMQRKYPMPPVGGKLPKEVVVTVSNNGNTRVIKEGSNGTPYTSAISHSNPKEFYFEDQLGDFGDQSDFVEKKLPSNPEASDSSIKHETKKKTIKMSHKRLIDGMIMAEILGPPRAKKPHSSIRR